MRWRANSNGSVRSLAGGRGWGGAAALAMCFVVRTNSEEGCSRIARVEPEAGSITGGEACGYLCTEKEGFTHPWLWRAPCFWGTHEQKLHAVDT
jgi:hypothetical protein